MFGDSPFFKTPEAQKNMTDFLALLRKQKWTIGFAESCTGGLLSAHLTSLAGVSDVFMGAVVSYANDTKIQMLSVSAATIQQFGAVSEPVVNEMSRGILKKLNVSCAISVSGIAGPSGGTKEKPVGTVWLAVLGPNFEKTELCHFKGDRASIQNQAAEKAIQLFLGAARVA